MSKLLGSSARPVLKLMFVNVEENKQCWQTTALSKHGTNGRKGLSVVDFAEAIMLGSCKLSSMLRMSGMHMPWYLPPAQTVPCRKPD